MEDFYVVQITTNEGQNKEFKILDTAGEEDYQNMLDKWINDAKGFILVFAINDSESFEEIKLKIKRIEKNEKNNLPIILVGNKCDLANKRTISEQQGKDLAKIIGGKYYETSALNDLNGNVKVVFTECAKMISECSDLNEEGKSKSDQFFINNLDHHLTGIQTVHHILSDCTLFHGFHKLLHHAEIDIRFQKRHLYFFQRSADILFRQATLASQITEDVL